MHTKLHEIPQIIVSFIWSDIKQAGVHEHTDSMMIL